jgi:hypothetical protein
MEPAMRFALMIAVATALAWPAGAAPAAGAEPAGVVPTSWSEVSAKKKAKKKAAPKEQYLRAVPSAPPPGSKK